MRCNNCGWDNPEGIERCQKCNQPLGTGSFFNPRATMIDVNPRSTMIDANPRSTMMEVNSKSTLLDNVSNEYKATELEVNPRATIADCPSRTTTLENPYLKNVSLVCMDDVKHSEIIISSKEYLAISSGDIILIGGLRYKVK